MISEIGSINLAGSDGLSIDIIDNERGLIAAIEVAYRIKRAIERFKPDVIHCQEAVSGGAAILSLLRWRAPLVLTIHDPIPHSGEDGISANVAKRDFILKRWRNRCDAAVTHGSALVEAVALRYPRLSGFVFSVPHGPLGGPPVSERPVSGTFLFFGRIHAYKGLGSFISAILALHKRGFAVRGVIAGRGPDLALYRSAISDHPAFELHERYIEREELHSFFTRAQAVVLPYTDGTQSGVGAMALGFGRAIIATRVGALPDMVRDGENGLLTAPADSEALASAMARLIADPEMAVRMGRRSLELARTEITWERNAEVTLLAYQAAIARRGGGWSDGLVA